MPESQIAAILAKLEMILVFIAKLEKEHDDCRAHCDVTRGVYKNSIQELQQSVSRLVGAKIDPKWIVAFVSMTTLIAGVIGFLIGHRGGIH